MPAKDWIEDADYEFVCSTCGSNAVQGQYWVKINTLEVVDAVEPVGSEMDWCGVCESHTKAIGKG